MKKLNFEQMENLQGGKIRWFSCGYCLASAVALGTGVLAIAGALELYACVDCAVSAMDR
ncbi:hypothetical protein [Proteiniphilum sp. X52]|uniref:hypothetical protein n=1 Tax=Proteiniphilum sp. X52 TaxID=2382159 RepID=UPI0013147F3C|nr:hypothetical protein [Proteiniphilum sp. X52]